MIRQRRVVFSRQAQRDLDDIYDHIATTSPRAAGRFVDNVESFCLGLGTCSERGRILRSKRSTLRMVGFERKLTIVVAVANADVTIMRVFSRGRDWERDVR
jgi:toxin ParE1/3/4